MKRIIAIAFICLTLCACEKKDVAKDVMSLYDGEIDCTVRIEIQSTPSAEYIIAFKRDDLSDTVEIISPSSVDGIKAQIQRGSAIISYEGKDLQTLLPSYWGTSPADLMSATFDCLASATPQRIVYDDKIMLEYKEITDNGDIYRYIWLDGESLAFERVEVEIEGAVPIKAECTNFQVY